jgi:hypothetical protein
MSSKMVMTDKVKDLQDLDPPGPAVQKSGCFERYIWSKNNRCVQEQLQLN